MKKVKSKKRIYKSGVPQHVYFKGKNSFGIFYSELDYLWFLTLYFSLAVKYGVQTLAFCPMFNHAHHASCHSSKEQLSKFQQELESTFAREYNIVRELHGSVFKKTFGSVPKSIGKRIATTLLYIIYNPKAGGIVSKCADYRWNLLAYYKNPNPFSEPLLLSKASARMRRAVKHVDFFRSKTLPLKYPTLRMLFDDLDEKEHAQLLDYIISRYNCMDYDGLISYFGSMERLKALLESTEPQEYDLKEDWDDYSKYEKMLKLVDGSSTEGETIFCPEKLSHIVRSSLFYQLSKIRGCTVAQVCKFLHMRLKR